MGTTGNAASHREPWSKVKILGQKAPFKLKDHPPSRRSGVGSARGLHDSTRYVLPGQQRARYWRAHVERCDRKGHTDHAGDRQSVSKSVYHGENS